MAEVLKAQSYVNADDEAMQYISHRPLEVKRRKVMSKLVSEREDQVFAVVAKDDNGQLREFIVIVQGDKAEVVMATCEILYSDITPSECVEYIFPEDVSSDNWRLACLSFEALESYRSMKFNSWKKMLLEPTCEAQFRRMMQIGLVTKLYDPAVFPTPDSLKSEYQVTDEKSGKLIQLPHPVAGLRIWDVSTGAYSDLDPRLTGAPAQGEEDAWWVQMIKDLKEKLGDEYVSGFLK